MSNNFFEMDHAQEPVAKIKVVGVGGAGGNAIRRMVDASLSRVEFIAVNTDEQVLHESRATTQLCIGRNITKGLGAGGRPDVGRQAIEEDRDRVADVLRGADMVFITAGMGGGTGTGASPVIAELARDAGALTVGVVTTPFGYEQVKRQQRAIQGIEELREHVDTLIVISNQQLYEVLPPKTPLTEAFKAADNVLLQAVQGITDIILVPGLINLDFADVRTAMSYRGDATMGSGFASGTNAAREAAAAAISSPLLEDVTIAGAKGLIVNITGNPGLTQDEITEAMDVINTESGPDADVFVGVVLDPKMQEGDIRITVIATGFELDRKPGYRYTDKQPIREQVRRQIPQVVHAKEQNLSIPTWQRKQQEVEDEGQPQRAKEDDEKQQKDYSFASDDIRVPTFVRKAHRPT